MSFFILEFDWIIPERSPYWRMNRTVYTNHDPPPGRRYLQANVSGNYTAPSILKYGHGYYLLIGLRMIDDTWRLCAATDHQSQLHHRDCAEAPRLRTAQGVPGQYAESDMLTRVATKIYRAEQFGFGLGRLDPAMLAQHGEDIDNYALHISSAGTWRVG
ncbi:hypothetical protein TruAng_001583 [Truncatella angustata]|nr:hypothetical protein TruAng_001583 [Truncatella angustata]